MKSKCRQLGISLLEVLLVLVIVASILLMAVRYFSVSVRNTRVATSVRQIQFLTRASYEWLQTQKQENFSDDPNGTTISLQKLIDAGLVTPDDKGEYLDSWGGNIIVAPGKDARFVKITFENLPGHACAQLRRQLTPIIRVGSNEPKCDQADNKNTYFGEF